MLPIHGIQRRACPGTQAPVRQPPLVPGAAAARRITPAAPDPPPDLGGEKP
jgi:hypothetical protein